MNSSECKEKAALNAALNLLDKKRYEAIRKCNNKIYEDMKKYFKIGNRSELMDFLWEKRNSDDSLYNILEYFPDNDSSILGFSRQHIFETIGQILLFTKSDNKWNNEKYFYKNINDLLLLTSEQMLRDDKINEGNIADISDIYFKHDKIDIVIQCKYLSKEKTDSNKYDIGKLFIRTS